MKKVFGSIAIIFLLIFALPASAAERVDGFQVEIIVNPDSSLQVSERINYNFDTIQRHGIYRSIPISYKTKAGKRTIRIKDIRVSNSIGQGEQIDVSTKNGEKIICIGDPDVLVSGQELYVISYRVEGALNYFTDHDELYWNATGDQWPVGIADVSVAVSLPLELGSEFIDVSCYAGYLGSNTACDSEQVKDGISFHQNYLNPSEGLTIAVGFPKGIVTEPSDFDNFLQILRDNLILLLPLLTLIVMWKLWQTRGKDPDGSGVVIAQYEPPENLTPAEIGTIIDEKVQSKDLSAVLIDLCVRGYMKVRRIEKIGLLGSVDYELTKLKEGTDLKNEFEKIFFSKLFSTIKEKNPLTAIKDAVFGTEGKILDPNKVLLSDLKNNFYKTAQSVEKKLYETVVEKGYFMKNPRTIRGWYAVIGVLIIGIGFGFLGQFSVYTGIAVGVSGAIVLIFSFFMPQKTQSGAQMRDKILGLKEYLSIAEKDRIEFHNAPKKSPERFEKLLPYAMVLGVEKQWAAQFEDIYRNPPSWYEGAPGTRFTALYLANSLGDFNKTAGTALVSTPRGAAGGGSGIGGGGFSGGGFGGGGGGSW